MNLIVVSRLFLAGITLAILYLSLMPAPPGDGLGWDKANHAAAMLAVTVLASHAIRPAQRAVFFGGLYGFGLGILIELLQGLCTTSRSAEWWDLAADALGAGAGMLAVVVWRSLSRSVAQD